MFVHIVLNLKKEKKSRPQGCRHPPVDLSPVILVNTTQAGVEYCYFPSCLGCMKQALKPYSNSSCTCTYLALQSCGNLMATPAAGTKPSSLLLKTLQVSSEARGWACWTCSVDSLRMAGFMLSLCHLCPSGSLVSCLSECIGKQVSRNLEHSFETSTI